jgi:hypothetical protein
MARFDGMIRGMAKTVRNFHLPLPEPLYRRLRDAAARANQPATTVARYALEHWLREHRRAAVRQAIAAYAAEMAGTPDDLDPLLEAASLESWAPARRRKKGKR